VRPALGLHAARTRRTATVLEIEQKYADADFADLQKRLTDWGLTEAAALVEEDHYHNAPDRDFKDTGEAFRLRRVGADNFLTYKGPRLDSPVKARPELEVPIQGGDRGAADFLRLLGYLGYRPVAVVRKKRRIYRLTRGNYALEVCLDDVDELGRFCEVEILAEPDRLGEARGVLQEVAAELGLQHVERRAYLTMLLERRGEKS
jgi:adenylate cyclase class 2